MPGRKSMMTGGMARPSKTGGSPKLSKAEAAKAIRLINAVADGKYDSKKSLPGWMMPLLKK